MEGIGKVGFIVGPTCSGKTEIAIRLAKKYDGEVICADSRTIYKDMDIGTAKPMPDEVCGVKHHGIDLINPSESYSVADFKNYALKKIIEIQASGKIPFVVGGSGLYAFSLIYDYSFPAGPVSAERIKLESKNIEELRSILQYLDIEAYENIDINNKRRLMRAIETAGMERSMSPKPANYLVIGLAPDKERLERRIRQRTEEMFKKGLEQETRALISKYGNAEALNTTGYKELVDYINKEQNLTQTKELINIHTRQLAKKQMTWFKRSKDISWIKNYTEAQEAVNKFMQI